MVEELIELLRRESRAVAVVEARLRALELVVAAGHDRLLGIATDELESASDQLAALEVARVTVMVAAGLPPDVVSSQLSGSLGSHAAHDRLAAGLDGLREASGRLEDARSRSRAVLSDAAATSRSRLDAAQALVGV